MMIIRSFALELYILYSGKGIELNIRLSGNGSKMRWEVKFAIKRDSQYSLFFAISNSNAVRYGICLNFIFNAKKHKGALIRVEDHQVYIKSV